MKSKLEDDSHIKSMSAPGKRTNGKVCEKDYDKAVFKGVCVSLLSGLGIFCSFTLGEMIVFSSGGDSSTVLTVSGILGGSFASLCVSASVYTA
ncbi:hypothetical protein ACFL0U_04440 [Pseudomonadota bacterium]